ncbi:hypothetical protein Trydic_g1046 [Trypoxylus dichotomus]
MDAVTNVHPAIVSRTPGYVQHPFLVHKNHRVCHVHFRDEDQASKSYLKKNAVPSLFLPVPTVDGRENVSDHKHCTSVAESYAPTPVPNGVLAICQISRSQVRLWFGNPFAKLQQVWLHLLIAAKHQYELPMEWSAIAEFILLEVLVPGPRAVTCNTFYRNL